MKSALRGRGTSNVEVPNVSKHGFWMLVRARELFLPFEDFPWFEDVPILQLLNVQVLHSDHLYWPELDVDLSIEFIEHPEDFPLVSCARPDRHMRPPRKRAVRG